MKPNIYLVMTRNCNCECAHCYIEAGPEQEHTTLRGRNFERVIDHLPKIPLELTLSGGEVFTQKRDLYLGLEYICDENEERSMLDQGKIKVVVQTNGTWATSEERLKSILFDLVSLGVKGIGITSGDFFHVQQGVNTKMLEKLESIAEKSGLFSYVNLRGASKKWIVPLGRAKQDYRITEDTSSIFSFDNFKSCKGCLSEYNLSIHPNGNLYTMCNQIQIPGNVIEEPLVEIVRKARTDLRLRELDKGGIRRFISRKDKAKEDKFRSFVEDHTECVACFWLYPDGVIKSQD